MEMDLKNIIDKIKTEGVSAAGRKTDEIIASARQKAKDILMSAEQEKETILKDARENADKLEKNAKDAVRQAARDVILALKENVVELLDKVLGKQVKEQLTPELIKDMIIRLVEQFRIDGKEDIEVTAGEKDAEKLKQILVAEIKKSAQKGFTIKASPKVEKGFRIGIKDSDVYYDFTDEAITENLEAYINPKLAKMLADKE